MPNKTRYELYTEIYDYIHSALARVLFTGPTQISDIIQWSNRINDLVLQFKNQTNTFTTQERLILEEELNIIFYQFPAFTPRI
jgi:hypothetical protein